MTIQSSWVEIACDESGFSGSNLLDPASPVITHGSAVVHDEQSALTRGRVARLGSFLAKAVSPAPPPLRSFRQVDSRDDPRIQVADLLAGIARRRTPKLNELIAPYLRARADRNSSQV